VSRVRKLFFVWPCCLQLILAGCVTVGGTAMRMNRTDYNEAVNDTNVEQLLLNIVRVHDSEIPTFMDMVELDEANSVGAGISGGPSNIGAKAGTIGDSLFGTIGAVTGSASVSDQPIAKYVPLSGYPLIQQISSPISLGAIAKFTNSSWPDSTLLYYSFERLTPAYLDFYRALDTILALDSYGSITLESSADYELTIAFDPQGNLRTPGGNWRKTLDGSGKRLPCIPPWPSTVAVHELWSKLKSIYGGGSGNTIVLTSAKIKGKSNVVVPRSGLGALKEAETDHMLFTDGNTAEAIRQANDADECSLGEFYYAPDSSVPIGDYGPEVDALWKQHFDAVYLHNDSSQTSREFFRSLGQRRVYIIVEQSDQRPADAYASVYKDGRWYSIAASDRISKQNFALLSEILTIQAAPVSNSSTIPTSIAITP